jgi:hypothetical protein
MTSLIHPCDAGIIKNFKNHYKKLLMQSLIEQYETTKRFVYPDVKSAIYKIVNAWSKVTSDTIRHCWDHVDIYKKDEVEIENEEINVSRRTYEDIMNVVE